MDPILCVLSSLTNQQRSGWCPGPQSHLIRAPERNNRDKRLSSDQISWTWINRKLQCVCEFQYRVTKRKRKRKSKWEKEYLFPWHRDFLLLSLSLPISVNKLLNWAQCWANITAAWNTKWEQLFQIGGSKDRLRRPRGSACQGEDWPCGVEVPGSRETALHCHSSTPSP